MKHTILEDFLYVHTTYDPDARPEDEVPLTFHRFLSQIYLNILPYWYTKAMKRHPSEHWLNQEEKILLFEERLMHPIIAIQEAVNLFEETSFTLSRISIDFLNNISVAREVLGYDLSGI